MKIGVYSGNTYVKDDEINECCFILPDDSSEALIQTEKEKHRQDCLLCAICCGFTSECSPCTLM